jgi:hypothetical protein
VPHVSTRTRSTLTVLAVVALLLGVAAGSGAAPGTPRDARSERERVRQERAAAAAELDVLEATNAQVEAALDALNANVAGQEAALADAQRAAEAAAAAVVEAQAREAAALAEIDALEARLREVAVDAYINAGNLDDASAVLETDDLGSAVQRRSLVGLRAGQHREVLAELQTVSEDLAVARADAEQAAEAAAAHRAEVDRRLGEITTARDQQATVAAQVDARIESALAEAANLEALDAALARQIAAEQAAIAARNRSTARPPTGGGGRVTRVSGNISLTTVRGITVATEIADELEGLLAAAESDGITFGGGGYRSSDSQIALREAHCGSSDYAIYEMPPSQCSPPTARPGQSMHERGLAVDFTYNGRVISSRSNPGYQWLAEHAGVYGFYNLPSEPWHWSTNGQ